MSRNRKGVLIRHLDGGQIEVWEDGKMHPLTAELAASPWKRADVVSFVARKMKEGVNVEVEVLGGRMLPEEWVAFVWGPGSYELKELLKTLHCDVEVRVERVEEEEEEEEEDFGPVGGTI